jgi:hypothetical protein
MREINDLDSNRLLLIMNDKRKVGSQIFCLPFASTIERDFNCPFLPFGAFENPALSSSELGLR